MAGSRRRTDGPGTPSPYSGSDLSEHPTTPGRRRADRRRDALLDPAADLGRRPVGEARPGLDPRAPRPTDTPVAARRRPPVPPPLRPVQTGPRTTMAPFQAVPTPQGDQEPEPDRPDTAPPPAAARPAPPAAAPRAAAPPAAPPASPPAGSWPSAPPYGDWTRPSRGGSSGEGPKRAATGRPEPADQPPARPAVANPFSRLQAHADVLAPQEPITSPGTTAIPERGSRDGAHEPDDHAYDEYGSDPHGVDPDDARGHDPDPPGDLGAGRAEKPARNASAAADAKGPRTGSGGGRAARRAELQAAEARRKAAGKGSGAPNRSDDGGPRRSPRRMALGLVAVAVVALGVLGVYSFASPDTKASSAQSALSGTATPPPLTGGIPTDLPAITSGGISGEAAPTTAATPIRVPVTVLNSTQINGLAGSISDALKGAGWETGTPGAYDADDVAATTVFFTQGDENQRQAALQLIQQFPQLQGPAPRFFDMPAEAPAGLVIVATGDWKP